MKNMPRRLAAAGLMVAATIATVPYPLARASILSLDEDRGVLTIAPMLEQVTPAVVNVSVSAQAAGKPNPLFQDPFYRPFFGDPAPMQPMSAGSGVIVDAVNGYILTNHHVIQGAGAVTVTLKDRRRFSARFVGSDADTDIALLQIQADGLSAIQFADSDALAVGDVAVAIGNPFGLGQTVTTGIVSAVGRLGFQSSGFQEFIQTDASINPGNSGGALVDSRGRLIGINTAIFSQSGGNIGIGFAVPSNLARAVMEQLIRYGRVERGRLGVAIQDVSPDIASRLGLERTGGALITGIAARSAAEAAGLRVGDVILAIDGHPVNDAADLRIEVGMVRMGESVRLTILRDGEPMEVLAGIGPLDVRR